MNINNFWVDLVATLKKGQSKTQIETDVKKLGNIKVPLVGTLDKVKTNAQLKKDLASLNGTVNLTGKINQKGVATSVQQATQTAQKQASKAPIQMYFDIRKEKLINDIKILAQQNSKLFKNSDMSAKYNTLLNSAELATSSKELRGLRLQLSAVKSEIRATSLSGLTLGDAFKKTFRRATELFSGTGAVMLLSNQLRKSWTEALALDKSLTNLSKVQDEVSGGDFPDYLDECNKKAQELAATQKELIEGATEFSKSGYNLTQSNDLSERSAILSNVGDMSASDSAKAIISGVQAYEIVDGFTDVIDKADALIDKYNEIGNTASITTEEIAKGVQSVGSVFSDANTSVDEFIALLAAGNRQYQDADSLSLGLRTAALRIRGCTTELELMGEETDGVYTSTSKLEEKISGLTNINGTGGVKLLEADGETFRSIYDIFLDISKVYQDMSDTDQSALLELISGKHRASAISATLNNMSEAQEIYQRSLNSTGSAQEEYDKYLQSSEASLNKFRASMTETYQNIISGETTKGILDCGNATLQFVNGIGLVESSLRGIIAIGAVKAITMLSTALKASAISANNFGMALNTAKNMSGMVKGTAEYATALNMLKTVSAGLSSTQLKQVLSTQALSDSERIAILRTTGLTKAQAQAKLAQMGLIQSTNAQSTANKTATTSTITFSNAVKGLGTSLKLAFLSNPIGISIMALSTVIGVVTSKVSDYNDKVKEARQTSIDVANEANTLGDEISDLASKYIALSEAVKTDASVKDDLISTQTELLEKLGLEGQSIDELTEKYGSLSNAIRQASIDSLKNSQIDLIGGVNATRDALLEVSKDSFLGQNNMLTVSGEEAVKAFKVLEQAGIVDSKSFSSVAGNFALTGDESTIDGTLENYKKLEDALNALNESGAFTGEELSENPLREALYNRYNEMKKEVDEYNESIENLNENLAQQTMLTALQGQEIPKTIESFETFKQELIDTAIASGQFMGSGEDIEKAINGYLSSVPEFADFYTIPIDIEVEEDDNAEIKTSIASLIEQLDTQLRPAFDTLKTAYGDIFTTDSEGNEKFSLENVDISMLSDLKSAVDELNEIEGISLDYSSFEDLSNVLTDTESSADDVKGAINSFATSILQSLNPAISECSGENYKLMQSMLESIGITNAEQVMVSALGYTYQDYISAKEETGKADEALNREAQVLIDSLGAESDGVIECGEALANFALKKLLINNERIETSDEVGRILTLANAAGIASGALEKLAKFKNDLDATDDTKTRQDIMRTINEYTKQLQSEIANVEVDYTPKQASASSSSSSSSKDIWLEEYKSRLSELKRQQDLGLISEREYYDNSNALYVEYLRGREKYAEESADAEVDLHNEWTKVYQAERDVIDRLYGNGQMSVKDYYTALAVLAQKYYVAKDSAEIYGEYLEELQDIQQEVLEGMKDMYDSAISGVISIIQGEINRIQSESDKAVANFNAQIDAIEDRISEYENQKDGINAQIDNIQKQIDKIDELADARERELNLQKASAELNRAENQRVQAVFRNGQLEYTVDNSAIAEAREEVTKTQEEIQKAELEQQISVLEEQLDAIDSIIKGLEKQQEAYSKMIEQAEKSYETRIEALETYMEQWEKLSEKADKQATLELLNSLGLAEGDILAGSQTAFNNIASSYDTLLSSIKTGNYDIVGQLGMLNTVDTNGAVTSIENLGSALTGLTKTSQPEIDEYVGMWQNGASAIASTIGTSGLSSEKSDSSEGDSKSADTGSESIIGAVQDGGEAVSSAFNDSWLPAIDEFGTALSAKMLSIVEMVQSMAESVVDSCTQANTAISSLQSGNPIQMTFSSTNTFKPYSGSAFASGLSGKHPEIKDALVGETGTEIVTDPNSGGYAVYDSPTIVDLPKDATVFNPVMTKEMLSDKSKMIANMEAHAKVADIVRSAPKVIDTYNSVSQGMKDATSITENEVNTRYDIRMGDIQMNGVNDVDKVANEIVKKFPMAMARKMNSTLK